MWVGLDLCDGLGWVEYFLTYHGGLGKKSQPDPCTPLALTRENQNDDNKSVEQVWKHNRSETSTHSHREEENERGCQEEKEGSPVPIFPPLKFRIVRTFPGSVGCLLSSFSFMGKMWFNRSKISTQSHREEEIERGCEEEKEGSPIPIFSPLRFEIMRLLTGWMGFCSKILGL